MKLILILISCYLCHTTIADETISEICKKLGEGLYVKDHTGCKMYISCLDIGSGQLIGNEYECPPGLLFNDETKTCDYEGAFMCYPSIDEVCTELGPGLHLKEGTKCKNYYSCFELNGEYIGAEQECPAGLLFNSKENKCDYEGAFKCYSGTDLICSGLGVGFHVKKNTECKSYYSCVVVNGEFRGGENKCHDEYLFNDANKFCAPPKSFTCVD